MKDKKKGLLQKMFPKNGELVPELRFPEFTAPWEQRKLGDMCDEFKSGSSILAKDICEQGEYPVYGGNGLRGYTATYNHDGIYALIGRQGALCGNMNKVYGKAYFTEHAVAVKANKNNNTDFLFFLLDKMNLRQYSGQSAQPGLAVNKLIELITLVPNCSEQKLIGIFFNKLDNLITLHQRKLDHLKEQKKALLQQMFI
ncbi:restriction endonuclease subunit S [Clostridium butyricum]